MNKSIRVLICDDSALVRVALKKYIDEDSSMEVTGVARNGAEAVEKARSLKPDVITMDVEMPVKTGLEALKEIVAEKIAPVIMFSSLTKEGASQTMDAMEMGAFDCVGKPAGSRSFGSDINKVIETIKKAAQSNFYTKISRPRPARVKRTVASDIVSRKTEKKEVVRRPYSPGRAGFKVIALGISTGGPKSIFKVLPELPADLDAAIIVVQHMPPAFIGTYAQRINSRTKMNCVETEAGMKIEPGNIYIAKGGFHLKLMRKASGDVLVRQSKEPQHLFVPSVDVMMDSVIDVFKGDTIGVLMTGMGRDGAEGMVKIAECGGVTIAESEETAIVYGMPQEAVRRGGAQVVAPNWDIAAEIVKAVNSK